MLKTSLIIISFVAITTTNAQTIFGKWENRDETTGMVDSVVEIYQKEEKAYAKIIEITDPEKRNHICTACKGNNKNKPILGMDILTGLTKKGNEWSGGEILDPKNGTTYKCFIQAKGKNKLKVRGYIGVALFGKTVYWQRKK